MKMGSITVFHVLVCFSLNSTYSCFTHDLYSFLPIVQPGEGKDWLHDNKKEVAKIRKKSYFYFSLKRKDVHANTVALGTKMSNTKVTFFLKNSESRIFSHI